MFQNYSKIDICHCMVLDIKNDMQFLYYILLTMTLIKRYVRRNWLDILNASCHVK